MRRSIAVLIALPLVLAWAVAAEAAGVAVAQMTTNGRVNPLGIGADEISFSWAIVGDMHGLVQRAYEVRLTKAGGGACVWDSGRVASEQQLDLALPERVALQAATRYEWSVRVWGNHGASGGSPPAWFETGLIWPADWSGARWISAPAPGGTPGAAQPIPSLPLFRRTINLTKPIRAVRIYASAHGVYQLSVNGARVGNESLAPGWTDYGRRIQAQTYDATALFHPGANVVGAALGDGWYRGKVGLGWRDVYGTGLALIAKIHVTYADGSTVDFVTDPAWKTAPGPFVAADLQDGESYDARREQPGWDEPGFNGVGWAPVRIADDDTSNIVPQPDEPVRVTQVLTAMSRATPLPGVAVYDLGQNMVGVARVKLTGRSGETVRIRYAEELYARGDRQGQLYTANLRTAKATDTYTFAHDGTVVYQPTFTQHGFRYVEITGAESPPDPDDVHGVVLGSDLPNTGDLRLSQPMLDQLVRNVRWGQRGNFLSIPTDTPARDERLGWTGDIAVFAATACRYQDTRAFLSKWLDDVRDAQRVDGNIPAVVPQPRDAFNATGVGWSDAFIWVPYAVWRASGDTRIVRRNWDWIRRFYEFVKASATHDGNDLEEGRSSWFSGDWLSLEDVNRLDEHRVIATAYFAEDTRMMADMAAATGHADDAAQWRRLLPKIRTAFCAAYRQPDGTIFTGTQTVYAMALGMGLIRDPAQRDQTARQFVAKLAADHYHLKTGFLGTPWLLPALSRIGRDDLAMRLLRNTDYPSWGYEIGRGATTLWERWNSILPDGEFGPAWMNSFNHYAYGAVADWMFQHLGGLQIIAPGYRKSRVAPLIAASGLRHAACRLKTPYGLLACAWTRHHDETAMTVIVPPGTTSEVVIPTAHPARVRAGSGLATAAAGVVRSSVAPGQLVLEVGSGRYTFTWDSSDRGR